MSRRETLFETIQARSDRGDVFFRPILMQFAAHYVGKSYRDFYTDHESLVAANIACMEAFGADAVGLISDPMREAEAYGARCEYPAEAVPHCIEPPVRSMADVEALPDPDLLSSARTRDRIAGARLFREKLGGDVPLIGWIEGPLAEACDLVGVGEMMLKLGLEPEFSDALLARVVPTAKAFAQAQIAAGCDIIGMGDSVCSLISPRMYRRYVMPLHREIIEFIHEQDAMVKLHICGNIGHLLPSLREIGPDIVDVDWMVDMGEAWDVLGPRVIRSGNLDPVGVVEQRSPDEVFVQTRALVEKERGRPFILSAGCEITPLTPPENLLAMRTASRMP